ncbi:hypothetical protein [Bacteroides salyersiae]|uniref:hypothetical protein n=1 Tax=Bacteroides salyersiae TaxID=291644 RepID=UPI001E2F2AC6|nr:hypothetical protein [Bacteroides salyersiae]
MRIQRGSGPKKCVRCLRSKEEAIKEHLATMRPCDNSDCPFHDDIINAIEIEKNKPKFKFGDPIKPTIKFGEVKKSSITFGDPRED